ncbi:hypothetical protein HNQ80_005237 [Anaerosolibacter carboniphilus]|uniref:Uncharacterized protein n=1 Tax=Anaerosolibacter carboniphilus TaxID=1417629 RepID=A0A841L9Z0_9FIRM|nr:hypothetical protein [Anaerosolibacter carboniphilus]MBB6219055.1 hypothetical protein [Anaerosolibacter carboniphilus]
MFKHLTLFLFILILLTLTFLLQQFFDNQENLMTFKSYVSPEQKLSQKLIDHYNGTDEKMKKEAKDTIVEITLKNLDQQQWLTYLDYIDLKLYTSNVLPERDLELIVSLNLSKDQAAMAIYRPLANEYIYTSKIENILPIEKIDFIPIPELGYNFIVSHQLIDERLGAFFIERFIKVYMYSDHGFKNIWQGTKFSEEIYRLQLQDPSAPEDQWAKVTVNNLIRFESKPTLHIVLETNQKKYSAFHDSLPSSSMFKLQDRFRSIETFYWHPAYQHFIIGEGLLKTTGKPIAILTDAEHSKENFSGYSLKNYRILTPDRKIEYISKDSIITTKP